ncbi:Gfo/Idh/MocA family oxidoreductase [Sphingomonas sp. BT552]|uniref:Gfo/Idh/MocA family oxidoreductase n=1 Tax=Sphingomonas longa TaxID=2778730 RepID=A0ABS2D8I2_9SPHN|nr:Gfo/Idh/MocA family oxidoreductase [Microvirga sp. SRT01]MBM6577237.1 Gfo/Idh/MocA family oxidoreductase [Sphingomonas sp. BT552]
MTDSNRRAILGMGLTAGLVGFAADALAQSTTRGDAPTESAAARPAPEAKYRVPFAVIGMDHNHIYGITDAIIRGGGVLTSFYATDPKQIAMFRKRYPGATLARGEDEILADKRIKLVCSAAVPSLRAPLGIRVMKAGKDYLSDKAAVTTLAQLAEVRRTIKQTGRKYGIMYSERLEVPAAVMAGQMVHDGAIGRVIQTVNLAPHRLSAPTRPDWFWDPARNGGILTDVGSHQADQFVYLTGSKRAHVVASQTGNFAHPDHPKFEDFGDMVLNGDGGTGYVRVDWFTPDGLSTWGDGRLFILGTEGYIELRKYVDIAGRPGGNHLFIADRKGMRYIDCSKVPLPFGPQFVNDIVEGTSVAQDQDGALLAAELVLTAEAKATRAIAG